MQPQNEIKNDITDSRKHFCCSLTDHKKKIKTTNSKPKLEKNVPCH